MMTEKRFLGSLTSSEKYVQIYDNNDNNNNSDQCEFDHVNKNSHMNFKAIVSSRFTYISEVFSSYLFPVFLYFLALNFGI